MVIGNKVGEDEFMFNKYIFLDNQISIVGGDFAT